MKIIKPDVQFITPIDGATILKRLEQCGRVCYKSEDKITEGSAEKFVAGIIKRGHEAVLEHCSFTVKFICDRGVSHEIVRFASMIFGVNTMPMFKKSGGKIFAVQFNKAEERALDQEIKKQIVENDRAFDMDKESSILWMLHTQFGFGPKRLKLAWKLFYAETRKLREHYLMEQADDGWLARKKLKDIGCDIEEWYREEGGKTDA